jgi:hypothetical protein
MEATTMEDVRSGGAKERSPNYPGIGLTAAIELARKLWQAEKRTTVPPDVAAKALGYNSVSGASRAALAAMRQYGLVDASGGSFTLSDLAVNILVHDDDTPDYAEAVRNAANNPDIFRELRQTHSEASDSAINAYLISKRKFSTEGAQKLVRAFRETNVLVSRIAGGYTEAASNVSPAPGEAMTAPSTSTASQLVISKEVTVMQYILGGGVRAEVRFAGGELQPSHIRRLEAYLKIAAESLENP